MRRPPVILFAAIAYGLLLGAVIAWAPVNLAWLRDLLIPWAVLAFLIDGARRTVLAYAALVGVLGPVAAYLPTVLPELTHYTGLPTTQFLLFTGYRMLTPLVLAELTLPKRTDPALFKQLDRTKAPLVYRWTRDGDTITAGAAYAPEIPPAG